VTHQQSGTLPRTACAMCGRSVHSRPPAAVRLQRCSRCSACETLQPGQQLGRARRQQLSTTLVHSDGCALHCWVCLRSCGHQTKSWCLQKTWTQTQTLKTRCVQSASARSRMWALTRRRPRRSSASASASRGPSTGGSWGSLGPLCCGRCTEAMQGFAKHGTDAPVIIIVAW
jgi:hypothetical protein